MPEWLHEAFPNGLAVPWETLFLRLGAAFALGGAVAGVYRFTHRRDETYQPTFVSTLVMLTILIALVTQVIGESVAKAFSLVGALSIVRFRTVVQDTRDTAFVIFAVVLGMAAGGGHLPVALAGLAVGGLAAVVVRPRPVAAVPEWNLTVRIGIGEDPDRLEPVFRKHLTHQEPTGSATSRQGAALDLTYRARLATGADPARLVAELNQLGGVQHVELQRR